MTTITEIRPEQHIPGVLEVNGKIITYLNGQFYEPIEGNDLTVDEEKAVRDYLSSKPFFKGCSEWGM